MGKLLIVVAYSSDGEKTCLRPRKRDFRLRNAVEYRFGQGEEVLGMS